jgi:hypothetical protein
MTKYKVGKLDQHVYLMPGDRFNLTFTESGDVNGKPFHNERLLHSEEITEDKTYFAYAVLRTPVGIGLILGETFEVLSAWLEETWPGGLCDPDEAIL